jgi:hypothetical protein
MSTLSTDARRGSYETDYRMAWWFSVAWTVLLAITLAYTSFRTGRTIGEVWQRDGSDGLAFLAAGWVSAWAVALLGGGSVRVTRDRLYVRRFRDRLLGRTIEIPVEDIVEITEVHRPAIRSYVLRVTTADERHIDIQYQMLRESAALKAALLDLTPAERS